METVQLVHWNEAEAAERAQRLEKLGYEVRHKLSAAFLRQLRQDLPAALVIDLGRLPAQGRDLAVAVRHAKATRHLPLVFVGGTEQKVAPIRKLLPDATFTDWEHIGDDLVGAIDDPPLNPVVPGDGMAGYAGRPLAAKLGITTERRVALVDAPPAFEDTVGEIPAGARLHRGGATAEDLIIWFVRSLSDLEQGLPRMTPLVNRNSMWIAWPKKSSRLASDLTQQRVRDAGLDAGLVDYKICAIDRTWSGLLFTRRKKDRS